MQTELQKQQRQIQAENTAPQFPSHRWNYSLYKLYNRTCINCYILLLCGSTIQSVTELRVFTIYIVMLLSVTNIFFGILLQF